LPKAILNYLALMGWSHPEEKEIFDMEEFIDNFALEDVHPVGPAFDPVKLEWMNGVYIRNLAEQDLYQKIIEFYGKQGIKLDEYLVKKTVPLIQERIKKLSDYMPLCRFLFEKPTEYEIEFSVKDKDLIKKIYNRLANIEKWTAAMVGEEMLNLAKEEGVKNKKFFQLLRVIITGKKISPPLNESMEILGKDECLERVHI
jgi:glutamyl/glutaminyl-tRNA synthetase